MIIDCKKCALSKYNCALPGEGNKEADILIIGQCPNPEDKRNQAIFTGSIGSKVDQALHNIGLNRTQVYLTNIVKCFSPPGKQLSKTFIRICKEKLKAEIEEVKPKVIITLGSKACSFFDMRFIANTNFYDDTYNCHVVVTHHPTKLLLSYNDKTHNEFKQAFMTARKLLEQEDKKDIELPIDYVDNIDSYDFSKLNNIISVDLETTGLNFLTDQITSIGISDGTHNIAIPIIGEYNNIFKKIKPIFDNKKVILQNGKFDYKFFKKAGIDINIYFDTMLAHSLIDREAPHSLSELALKYLHTNLTKGTIDFVNDDINHKQRAIYATNDAWMTYKLYEIFKPIMDEQYEKVFYDIMVPTTVWLAEAEYRGIKVDRDYIQSTLNTLQYKKKALLSEISNDPKVKEYLLKTGEEFKINSSVQLKNLLYKHLKCKNKTNNTTESTLEYLANMYSQYTFISKIVEYRHLHKLYRTYLKNLMEFSEIDSRVHCEYNQTRVATGRLSCSSPNTQNIPKDGELARLVRKAFVAEEGYVLVEADFKQAEFRSLAHYSRDTYIAQLIEDGKDIHKIIASTALLKREEEVTSHERTLAKTIVFGLMYGRGAKAVAAALKIPIEQAYEIKNTFFKMFKQSTKWLKEVQQFAKKYGYVKTLTGRKITLPQVYSRDEAIASKAMRCSVNYPIQSTAADLTNLSGALLYKALRENNLDAHIIMNIHDALVVECRREILQKVKELMTDVMTRQVKEALGMRVKLEIDINYGTNLAEHE